MSGELICALSSRMYHVLYQVQVLQKGNINLSLNARGITHAQWVMDENKWGQGKRMIGGVFL